MNQKKPLLMIPARPSKLFCSTPLSELHWNLDKIQYNNNDNNNSIQFFILMCCVNSQMANYRYSTNKQNNNNNNNQWFYSPYKTLAASTDNSQSY
jgi:hypothetical protein